MKRILPVICKVVLSFPGTLTLISPLIVSYDTDGLVSICHPCDRSLSHNLSEGEGVRSRIGQVDVVLKHACLVSEVWSFRKGRVSYTERCIRRLLKPYGCLWTNRLMDWATV